MALISSWLVLAAAATAPQVPETAVFTLRAEVETAAEQLFLADVAECAGAAAVCEEAYAVEIGTSPAPGKTLFIPVDKLRTVLASEWPSAAVTLAAGKPVKVTASAQAVGDDVVLASLRQHLAALLAGQERFAVSVVKVQTAGHLNVRPGDVRIEFPELTAARFAQADWVYRHATAHQRLTAQARREETGELLLEFPVTAALELREQLPVMVRSLAAGDIVTASDLDLQWVAVAAGRLAQINDLGAIIGWRLRRPAVVGQPLTAAQLELPLLIRKGQMVRLHMHGEGVAVSGQVEAMANASAGQTIDVMYPATKKRLRARVLDDATVEYAF